MTEETGEQARRPETSSVFLPWTDQDRSILTENGAVIYTVGGETIRGLRLGGRNITYQGRSKRLLGLSARKMEIAVFTDPRKFWLAGTNTGSLNERLDVLAQDAQRLKSITGIEDLDEILPEAPEAMAVICKYFDETDKLLLATPSGENDSDFNSIITNTGVTFYVRDDWVREGHPGNVCIRRWYGGDDILRLQDAIRPSRNWVTSGQWLVRWVVKVKSTSTIPTPEV